MDILLGTINENALMIFDISLLFINDFPGWMREVGHCDIWC